MGSYFELVDVSSGEEEDNNNNISQDGSNGSSSLNWISGILNEEFDDLIVMDEISTPPKRRSSDGKIDCGNEDFDDDDCLMLDSDPDKVDLGVDCGEKEGSDELEIVGEKGQVACRDFPHPRHLCANFPFSSTPHEKHCKMCHCYVCESLAPCASWTNSASTKLNTICHCNATDKDPFWKKLREMKKNSSKTSSLVTPNFINPASSDTPWQPVNHYKSNMMYLNPNPNPNPNPRVIPQAIPVQTQNTRMNVMRACPTSHRAGPYHHPIRSRHLSRSSSMQAYSTNHSPPAHPVLSPNPTLSSPVLNRSHSASTSQSLLRMRQSTTVWNSLVRRTDSQSGEATQAPAQLQSTVQDCLADVDSKSWQDILASVATELGVPDYCADNATQIGTAFQPDTGVNQSVNGTGLESNVAGTNDVSLGEMNVNSQGASVNVNLPLYDFEGNWGSSAPI